MPMFYRTANEYFDPVLYDALTTSPDALDALDESKLRQLSYAAAAASAASAHARGECAHASVIYACALRILQYANISAGDRRVRRIELRVKLGDARAGAGAWRSAASAYAAALRDAGLIAKKMVPVSVKDDTMKEWNDGVESAETYVDGGDEKLDDDGAATLGSYLARCNASASKASIKGLFTGETLFRIGEACHHAGRYGRALLAYETALVLQPDGPTSKSAAMVWLACGEMFAGLGKPEAAIKYFTKVMTSPNDAALSVGDVLCEMATCYAMMKREQDAERCMGKVCNDEKSAPVRITNIIKVAWHQFESEKNTQKALKTLKEVNEIKKTSEGLYTLGRMYYKMGNFDGADACLIEACEMDPLSPKIWLEIGTLYLKGLKLPEIALKSFGRARELATAIKAREEGYVKHSSYGSEVENLTKHTDEEVVTLEDEARMYKGDTHQQLGQPSHALREYEECVDSARIQMRKLKIIVWAVILLQRAFRAHRERKAIKEGRKPLKIAPVVVPPIEDAEQAKLEAYQRQLKPRMMTSASKKYDMMREPRKVTIPEEQKSATDLMKSFTLGDKKKNSDAVAKTKTNAKTSLLGFRSSLKSRESAASGSLVGFGGRATLAPASKKTKSLFT